MGALFDRVSLSLDTFADYSAIFTILTGSSAAAMLDLGGSSGTPATVTMTIRATPSDTAPLLTVSTSPSPSGALVLGVALPPPAGASATSEAVLQEIVGQGVPTLSMTPPEPVATVLATVAALEAMSTAGVTLGTVAFVSSTASWYAYSPGSTVTPNGTTVVAATDSGGNWLLCGTIAVTITNAATIPLVGTSRAIFDVFVTWPNNTTTPLLSGTVDITQSAIRTGAYAP
jgi:hypothetical protein